MTPQRAETFAPASPITREWTAQTTAFTEKFQAMVQQLMLGTWAVCEEDIVAIHEMVRKLAALDTEREALWGGLQQRVQHLASLVESIKAPSETDSGRESRSTRGEGNKPEEASTGDPVLPKLL
ncbi:hypothetical protein BXT84_00465 [Sulfobacillus thermotolerans]|uniref:Uncharacterized protein n=1 Tax=Sulfobacillus thermotolerans TaxID=338644 RepID=A0ABM6RMQ8_9FIRM|nr:hypothetical protein BXT84_00465 [Sulfobacillus thermotolerans]